MDRIEEAKMILDYACFKRNRVYYMDVKTKILHGELEEVYTD